MKTRKRFPEAVRADGAQDISRTGAGRRQSGQGQVCRVRGWEGMSCVRARSRTRRERVESGERGAGRGSLDGLAPSRGRRGRARVVYCEVQVEG